MDYITKGIIGASIFVTLLISSVILGDKIAIEFGFLVGVVTSLVIMGLLTLIFIQWTNHETRKMYLEMIGSE